jgi:O-antigen/teichoic acid export membrane protein
MGLMAFTVNFSDRYFLRILIDMQTVGIYALGYKLGMMVGFLVGTPFHLVWSAQAFEIAKSEGAQETYARILTYYGAALLAVCGILSITAREIVVVMAAPEYAGAAVVVPVIAWSILFLNANDMLQVGILLEKRTFWLPTIWGGTTIINLGLNFLLIPRIGMMGAAWATLAAFAFQSAATAWVSNRLYPIRYEWRRLVLMVAVALAALASGMLIGELPVLGALALKGLILAGFAGILLVMPGFLQDDERALVSSLWSRLSARRAGDER